jgi:hypothetical protein
MAVLDLRIIGVSMLAKPRQTKGRADSHIQYFVERRLGLPFMCLRSYQLHTVKTSLHVTNLSEKLFQDLNKLTT